jgi:hypothetical protein
VQRLDGALGVVATEMSWTLRRTGGGIERSSDPVDDRELEMPVELVEDHMGARAGLCPAQLRRLETDEMNRAVTATNR